MQITDFHAGILSVCTVQDEFTLKECYCEIARFLWTSQYVVIK